MHKCRTRTPRCSAHKTSGCPSCSLGNISSWQPSLICQVTLTTKLLFSCNTETKYPYVLPFCWMLHKQNHIILGVGRINHSSTQQPNLMLIWQSWHTMLSGPISVVSWLPVLFNFHSLLNMPGRWASHLPGMKVQQLVAIRNLFHPCYLSP